MINLHEIPEIAELERLSILRGTLSAAKFIGQEERLLDRRTEQISELIGEDIYGMYSSLDIVCIVIFGAPYSDIPQSFLNQLNLNISDIEVLRWGRRRGYNLADVNGLILQNGRELVCLIEALAQKIIEPDSEMKAFFANASWAERIESEAKSFKKAKPPRRPAA